MPTGTLLLAINLQLWLTPMWLVSLGVAVGVAILFVLYGVLWLCSRRLAGEVPPIIQEGVLLPITYLVLALAVFSVVGGVTMVEGREWQRIWRSVTRIPSVGLLEESVVVPAGSEDFEVGVSFRADELRRYSFASSQDLRIAVEPGQAFASSAILVQGNEVYEWSPVSKLPRTFQGDISRLYVTNESGFDAELNIEVLTDIELSHAHDIPITAAAVVLLYVLYWLMCVLFPKLAAIAVATAKEAISQPLYVLSVMIGVVALIAFIYIPYNTFGEDVKILKNSGLELIMVLAIIVALWTASVSVAEEIEGRTAITLLSKPISRRQFVIGKFVGILWPLLLLFVILGFVLMMVVPFKVIYDARETSNPTPDWQYCYLEMIRVVPGLVLTFMEAAVLAAISVAISTRMTFLPNLVICGTIYVIGHLLPRLVQSSATQLEFVGFFGKFLAVVLPMLDYFNIQTAVAGGRDVPLTYLAVALLYCVIYCTVAMLVALILFEDRDLA